MRHNMLRGRKSKTGGGELIKDHRTVYIPVRGTKDGRGPCKSVVRKVLPYESFVDYGAILRENVLV